MKLKNLIKLFIVVLMMINAGCTTTFVVRDDSLQLPTIPLCEDVEFTLIIRQGPYQPRISKVRPNGRIIEFSTDNSSLSNIDFSRSIDSLTIIVTKKPPNSECPLEVGKKYTHPAFNPDDKEIPSGSPLEKKLEFSWSDFKSN